MATKGIETPKLTALRVLILASDGGYAHCMAVSLERLGVADVEHVETLTAATSVLRRRAVDIIIAEIHADRADGLMVPCMVSELDRAGRLHRIPHVIWTADQNTGDVFGTTAATAGLDQGWQDTLNGVSRVALLSHARLARTSGIQVEIAPDSSTEGLIATIERLADVTPQPPHVVCANSAEPPDEEEVVSALASGAGLRVVYQPQYHLQTQRVVGAEALVRWQHPRYGDVSPSVLIPLVNQLGLDLLLFSFIEKSVIETLVSLDKAGIDIPVAVNASAKTLCAPGLATRLATKMHKAGLPTKRLKIELTEDVATDNELALSASITALRAKGFQVSLDDFGAGAATLALLSQMPFDEMKIDGALVRAVGQTATSREVISGVVALAKLFNLTLVTEGIEDESTIALLNQLGCEVGQGYALAHPLELGDFMQLVGTRTVTPLFRKS
ncbi:EAL domain-containing protein [Pseudomonas sp. GD03944]|uniref:EAL domain-containing protein n=1 Tax=Pseudomonas sp. GD03944 TaxID=2975409 RepID=UPI002446A078|nr:EAL domain-containing protein [Pseudomonas sp. GD03944]MDH1263152.1 EAL domain-containing protein [Pseudomonas sp. GD03944]